MAYSETPHKKNGGPKAPFAIYDPLCPILYPNGEAEIIGDCLENQFTSNELRNYDHKRQLEATVNVLPATVDEEPLKFQLSDISKEIKSLKLGKAGSSVGVPSACLRYLPRRDLVH
jgi:hypothetical protein